MKCNELSTGSDDSLWTDRYRSASRRRAATEREREEDTRWMSTTATDNCSWVSWTWDFMSWWSLPGCSPDDSGYMSLSRKDEPAGWDRQDIKPQVHDSNCSWFQWAQMRAKCLAPARHLETTKTVPSERVSILHLSSWVSCRLRPYCPPK